MQATRKKSDMAHKTGQASTAVRRRLHAYGGDEAHQDTKKGCTNDNPSYDSFMLKDDDRVVVRKEFTRLHN